MKQIAFVTFLMLNGAIAFAQNSQNTFNNNSATMQNTNTYNNGDITNTGTNMDNSVGRDLDNSNSSLYGKNDYMHDSASENLSSNMDNENNLSDQNLSGKETGFYSGYGASSKIYTVPSTLTPTTTTALGRAPQFPALRHISSADEMYSRMKDLGSDPKYGTELNNLFIGMGYTGVNDPAFGPEDLEQAKVPYGAMGLMGSRGNSYRYTMVALPGKTSVDAWHVKPQTTGKDLYFFAACGNAFYYSNAPKSADVIVKEKYVNDYSGYGKVKVQVYARSKVKTNCTWCGKCADWTEETVLLSEDDLSQIPVAKNGDTDLPVRKVYVDMDNKTFNKIKAKEENGEYKMKADESVGMQ